MFRQIITPQNTPLILKLPTEFIGHKVEVIAFSIDSVESKINKLTSKNRSQKKRFMRLKNFISKNPIKLPEKYKFNREELYE